MGNHLVYAANVAACRAPSGGTLSRKMTIQSMYILLPHTLYLTLSIIDAPSAWELH